MGIVVMLDSVHRLAAAFPPDLVSVVVLIAAAAVTLVCGLVRSGRGFLRHFPAVGFVVCGAMALWPWPRSWVHPAAVAAAAVALLWELTLQRRRRDDPRAAGASRPVTARVYLAIALVLAAGFLFYDLGGYAGSLLVWEAPVVGAEGEGGFAAAVTQHRSILGYAADCFRWDDGLVSAGETSLFYGAPTYALFHVLGFSPWTLRCAAALAALLSIVVISLLARRFFDGRVAGAVAVLFGLNACVLFYGRYGSSPSGTLLAALLALACTWLFLDARGSAWWTGGLCAAALYVATLQYSIARIVVLTLLGFIPVVLIYQWRRFSWQRAAGFGVIVMAVVGVWHLEGVWRAQHAFLAARGEQYFACVAHQDCVRGMLHRAVAPEALTPFDKIELLYRTLETTVPEYLDLLTPHVNPVPPGAFMALDPPPLPLYYAPLILFIIWGIGHSLVRLRSWRHACLFAWVCGSTVPLLLTNRVDAHRMMLFVVPLSLWAALGVWEATQVMAQAKVPVSLQHVTAAALVATLIYSDANLLYYSPGRYRPRIPYSHSILTSTSKPPLSDGRALAAEIASVHEPVAVGAVIDHRQLGWALLTMLERGRRNPEQPAVLLSPGLLQAVRDRGGAPPDVAAAQLLRAVKRGTVILGPARLFQGVSAALQRRGVRVETSGSRELTLARIELGMAAIEGGPPQLKPHSLPTAPTVPAHAGMQQPLTELPPLDVAYGFTPPKIDRAWDDAPIVMHGVHYPRGVGMHAWCRITYSVPRDAEAFQAIIGLADDTQSCPAAAVTFEVRDEKGRLLYQSGLMVGATPPRTIRVDVRGVSAITLIVTDGGNGRDCDHANWASPAFLFPAP